MSLPGAEDAAEASRRSAERGWCSSARPSEGAGSFAGGPVGFAGGGVLRGLGTPDGGGEERGRGPGETDAAALGGCGAREGERFVGGTGEISRAARRRGGVLSTGSSRKP